jgi:hypothetical protein
MCKLRNLFELNSTDQNLNYDKKALLRNDIDNYINSLGEILKLLARLRELVD